MSELRQLVNANPDLSRKVLTILKRLKKKGPGKLRVTFGICSHFNDTERALPLLGEMWQHWPKYSGLQAYPVPVPEGSPYKSAWEIYRRNNWRDVNQWDGPYGDLRKELLNWLIETIEEHLEP